MDNASYKIDNIDNYNPILEITPEIAFNRYANLINEYIISYNEKLISKQYKNNEHIFKNGFETIVHVFKLLLLYTNNLDLTNYHCQRSIYYYIEFMEQIKEDDCVFLNLSSKDGTLFVYKKTIFDVPDSFKNTFKQDNNSIKVFDKFTMFVNVFNPLIYNYIENNSKYDYNEKKIKLFTTCIQKLNENMLNNSITFICFIFKKLDNFDTFQDISIGFTKKVFSVKHFNVEKKLLDSKFEDNLNTLNNTKFINWLFHE